MPLPPLHLANQSGGYMMLFEERGVLRCPAPALKGYPRYWRGHPIGTRWGIHVLHAKPIPCRTRPWPTGAIR